MGYTHYWRRRPALSESAFQKAAVDIKMVIERLEQQGLKLAGPMGSGELEISSGKIAFNGILRCGHARRHLGITWPAKTQEAGGIGTKTAGTWFGGALLMERTCGGDCSHESFWIDREVTEQPDNGGRVFEFCKTAYKPYDIAVTAALIILDHHLGDEIAISSDGEDKDWRDGAMVCQMVLGYGANFRLREAE